ncbi:MAG TPA: RHS repeat-associated core domain-containing protein [Candidatus Didemnitutus sp.]|nr:RHS repeat-associated core domain-containing protein [Candidatus Didemnitutus sp.]
MKRLFSVLLLVFATISLPRLMAVEPVQEGFAVRFASNLTTSEGDSGYASLTLTDEYGTQVTTGNNNAGQSTGKAAYLRLGKPYNATFSGTVVSGYFVNPYHMFNSQGSVIFMPPPGWNITTVGLGSLTPNFSGSSTTSNTMTFSYSFTVQIVASDLQVPGGAPNFSGFQVGKSIAWQVGLGALRSGRAAGNIGIVQPDVTLTAYSRDALVAAFPANSGEIPTPARNGSLGQTLQQVQTPLALFDLVDDSGGGGYTINIYTYDPSHWTGSAPPYSKSISSPPTAWKTIHVYSSGSTVLLVDETEGTRTTRSRLSLDSGTMVSGNYQLTLQEGDTSTWTRTTTHNSTVSGSTRDDIVVVRNGGTSGTIVAKSKYHYENQPWGEEMTQLVVDPDTTAMTTTYAYFTTSTDVGNYGQIKSITYPTNNWVSYAYYNTVNAQGQLQVESHPFGNPTGGAPAAAYTVGNSITYDYQQDWNLKYTIPNNIKGYASPSGTIQTSQETQTVTNGLTLNSTTHTETYTQYTKWDYYDNANHYLVSQTEIVDPITSADYFSLPLRVMRADQSQDSYAYYLGNWNSSTKTFTVATTGTLYFRSIVWHGSSSSSVGDSFTSFDGQDLLPIHLIANKSTKDVVIRDPVGNVIRKETWVYVGSGNFSSVPVSSEDLTYDFAGRMTDDLASNGAETSCAYTNGMLTQTVDPMGVEIDYSNFDGLGRALTVAKASGPTTNYVYDAAGNLTSTTLTDGTNSIVSSTGFNLAGPYTQTLPGQTATGLTRNYSVSGAGWSSTKAAPDTGTTINTYSVDGMLQSTTGTAVVAEYYSYGVESDGRRYTQTNVGGSSSSRMNKSWVDWLGRTIETEKAGFSISGKSDLFTKNTYDGTTGLLSKTRITNASDADQLAPTLYFYDTLGALAHSGQDMDATGTLVNSSTDRMSDQDISFDYDGANWWLKSTATTYPVASVATAATTYKRVRLTGLTGGVEAEIKTTDLEGNTVDSTTTVNRSTKTVTTSTSAPGMASNQSTVSVNGLTTSATGFDGLVDSVSYDGLERAHVKTNPRNKTTTIGYKSGTTLVETVIDESGTTIVTNDYDSCGRLDWTHDSSSPNRYTRYKYDPLGRVYEVWGNGTYPVSYGYDATYGDRTSMTTYQGAPSADSPTWPSVGTGNTTTWMYDTASGLLYQKTDAASHTVEFDYNVLQQTYTRKWARGLASNPTTRVLTTYGYDANTGELTSVSYNDTLETYKTPTLSYGYTRGGQLQSVGDGAGTRNFNYVSGRPWRLDYVALPAIYGSPTRRITELYETSSSSSAGSFGSYGYTKGTVTGRNSGFDLGISGTQDRDLEQTYTYSNGGWFIGVSGKIGSVPSQDVSYGYYYDSTAGKQTRLIDGYSVGLLKVSRSYDSQRDLMTSIASNWNTSTTLTQFTYGYDSARQRTTMTQFSGATSPFADYTASLSTYTSVYNNYSYNDRGELQTSAMYRGTPGTYSATSTNELPGRRFEYRYDSIGNRTLSGETGSASSTDDQYTTTATNGYDHKENNVVRVLGTAAPSAHLAVSQSPGVTQVDQAWAADLEPANEGSPVAGTATIYGAIPGATDYVASTTKVYLVPKAWEQFTYDEDGNLKGDETWTYVYDAENRLVEMENPSTAIGTGKIPTAAARKLVFVYDYLGRRVEKITYPYGSGSYSSTPSADTLFLYNGWNLIAEINNSTGNITRSYSWGLDLVGSLDQTGGVGGLLQIHDYGTPPTGGTTYWPTYDGNGNVVSLVNGTSGSGSYGTFAAAYEYDPFGGCVRSEMRDAVLQASASPFTFSTKYADFETGLLYYGTRFYSPSLGRFLNRDTIGEQGGLNLYAFCGNNGVGSVDTLGMDVWLDLGAWYQNFAGWNDSQRAKARLDLNNGFAAYFGVPATGPGTRVPGLAGSVDEVMPGGPDLGYTAWMQHVYRLWGLIAVVNAGLTAQQAAVQQALKEGKSQAEADQAGEDAAYNAAAARSGRNDPGSDDPNMITLQPFVVNALRPRSGASFLDAIMGDIQADIDQEALLNGQSNPMVESNENSTSIWNGNQKNNISNWKNGKYPGLDSYLAKLGQADSDLHKQVADSNATITHSVGGKSAIWEAGYATVIASDGTIVGSKIVNGRGPDEAIYPADIKAAFDSIQGSLTGVSLVFFHDHSDIGSVLTNGDIIVAKALGMTIIARRGGDFMMYTPPISQAPGGMLWSGNVSYFHF